MVVRDTCPACESTPFKNNGQSYNGKQNHQCKGCGRQFVQGFEPYRITAETRALIERLLLERISLRGMCRAVGVGLKWLLGFLVTCCKALPDHVHVRPITGHPDVVIQRLAVAADAMASCVQKQATKQWSWLAMDTTTRPGSAFHSGDRRRTSAKKLWARIPPGYRRQATFYTDQYVVYAGVIPPA